MNKLILSALAAVALGGPVLAADLPSRKAPEAVYAAPYVFNWTGAYVGAQAGYGWSHTSYDFIGAGTSAAHNGTGGLLGARIGYNYQMSNNFVVGLELEGSGSWDKGSSQCPGALFTCAHNVRSLGSLDARLGYAMDRFLISATGGVALANVRYATTNSMTGIAFGSNYSQTFTGWTLGAEADYAVTNNIVVSLAYKYYDFGSKTAGAGSLGLGATQVKPRISALMAGVAYKF